MIFNLLILRYPAFSNRRQTQQPDANPHELTEPSQQREGDSRHVTVAESLEQQKIAGILGTQTARDEERSALDKNRKRPYREGGQHIH